MYGHEKGGEEGTASLLSQTKVFETLIYTYISHENVSSVRQWPRFAATFTKRTDGSLRTMRCRLGVHQPPFPAHAHGHPTQEPPPVWRFVYAYPDVPHPLQLAGAETIATASD